MKIWTENGFVEGDNWGYLAQGAELLSIGDVAQSTLGVNLGVRVEPDDDVSLIERRLDDIALIAVNFPAFNDGRAFSHAALLRDRYGFKGEIRAFGHVLLDQVPFMLRTGIDSLEVTDEATIKHLGEGNVPAISHHYQPSQNDNLKTNSYSWRYRAS